ncbi:MAG TPA: dienelactone hydrolase family protein [Thermoanaerobaculia bacterium]|nr:dienelactone hydrolase family protein [Thermoanaerobaculia bacterium]
MAERALRVRRLGPEPRQARGTVILLHGRGATAESILSLVPLLDQPDLAWLAPQAPGGSWYPQSFLAPFAANEPFLSSSLEGVAELAAGLEAQEVPPESIAFAGFSQGACLATEVLARGGRRRGGLVAFTGGLIGPPGGLRSYSGDLAGTPAFLGAGDPDPHVPRARVEESAALLAALGAQVTLRIYPGIGHTVTDEELAEARGLLAGLGVSVRAGGRT